MYIVVRKDLSYEQQCVQACHAGIEACRTYLPPTAEHPHLVLCSVKNNHKLSELIQKLHNHGISYKEFREPDLADTITAVATAPLAGEARAVLSRYQLLRFS